MFYYKKMRKALFALVAVAAIMPAVVAVSTSISLTIKNFGYHVMKFNTGMSTALMANLQTS